MRTKPSPAHLAWHEMELGMFFHFDIPVFRPGWNWRDWSNLPDPDLYQPEKLDTDQWLQAARDLGAGYAVFVAKHCSGFLQWQSDLYPYGVRQTSWRSGQGDVVADFVESCNRYNIKPGLYASVSANAFYEVDNPGLVNRGKGGDSNRQAEYVRVCERMAEELWTRYGDLFEIWFDGGAISADEGGPDLVPLLKRHQPNAVVFQGPRGAPNLIRWVGNEDGVAPYPCWGASDTGTAEAGAGNDAFTGSADGSIWMPGECDVPIRNHEWFWTPDGEKLMYSLDELKEMYFGSVGRNCNLLLNANPGPDGLVPETDIVRYKEFGSWIKSRFADPVASVSRPFMPGESAQTITLELDRPTLVDTISIMEDITEGHRIRSYEVDAFADGNWSTVCTGTCVGHRRIERIKPTTVNHLRLTITESVETPRIREFSVYRPE